MRNSIGIILVFLPLTLLGQDKNLATDFSLIAQEFEKHLFQKVLNDPEGNMEMTLIDDRNFYRSLINFDLERSYSLSFTAKDQKLFKFIDNQEITKKAFDFEPLWEFNGRLLKSSNSQDLFEDF
ncbi:hypothetical protein HC174_02100 [Salinimicrobium sp. CDJ15-81-2]|nr:hypothetical protein [Salinimicrobium nanhaiense]